jgi:PAS domain S-box-containing protein
MIESSLDSLVAISPEGMITDANEATVAITGVPRDELIGTAFSDYFTDPERANRIYQLVFEKGMAVDYSPSIRHRGGAVAEVRYNASVYRDADGNVLGVFAAARDVTKRVQEQKESVEQQAREREQFVDLQQFQRLTVGRELKMTELKKENEFLRALLPRGRRPIRRRPTLSTEAQPRVGASPAALRVRHVGRISSGPCLRWRGRYLGPCDTGAQPFGETPH